ncbi:spore germination protein [Clostridium sp. DL1XJH146]
MKKIDINKESEVGEKAKDNKQANMDSISDNIKQNKKILQNSFNNSIDVVFYEFETISGMKALVIYIEDIVKKEILDRDIINPFILKASNEETNKDLTFETIKKLFPVTNTKKINDLPEVITNIADGNTIIFIEGVTFALSISCIGWEKRAVAEPASEMVIKGPKEGFIESININRALIRRKIKNENLVFEEMSIGRQTKTKVNIVYINGIVSLEVLAEVRKRLSNIDIDAILDTGSLEEYIEDSHISPVSTVGNTQKPDIVAAKILEGRVAILCDGSPQVITVPHLFIETIHTSEDYYSRPYIATVMRFVRMNAIIASIFFPAFYVALETFHQEMIPTVFLLTMAGANIGTPLSSFLEALLMVIAFELLKESGTRMPKALGSAVSIVGALVLGEAAVQAGIVSADLIVVIAFTAVATFIVPSLNEMVTLYRFILLILAGSMGIYGITAGTFVMIIHANSLTSFGVPYLSPLAPVNIEGLKDFLIRFPLWTMKKRPEFISGRNKRKQS